MTNNSIFVGLDVHKNAIDIAIAQGGCKGQVRHYGKGIVVGLRDKPAGRTPEFRPRQFRDDT
jgi:hypothetical protein